MLTRIRTRQEYLGLSLRALSKQLEVSPALLLTLLGISASLQFIQYLIFQLDPFVRVRSVWQKKRLTNCWDARHTRVVIVN